MTVVRELHSDELDAFTTIAANAYQVIKVNSAEERQQYRERLQEGLEAERFTHVYGCFRDATLVGGMKLFDWTVNLHGSLVQAGGVGMVAVDLMHKKQHVAKDMIEYFIRHYHERGAAWTMLYPFRPDFYRRMGFGYGAKMNMYRIKPASFPRIEGQRQVAALGAGDTDALMACYARFSEHTHGMIVRTRAHFERLVGKGENRVVGALRDGEVRGYYV